MDKVVHFEIPVDDLERAKAFYGSVFGWGLQTMSDMNDYTIAMTTAVDEKSQAPTDPGAINGALTKRAPDTVNAPVMTIQVGSIDASMKQIEAEGGTTVQARTEIPGMGAFAYFRDSEGNVMGLWETM
jgi:predicted enzyme related to lactoylglutathione lyase